jgi:hypothetical protein
VDVVETLTVTITRAERAADHFGVTADQVADSIRRVHALDLQDRTAFAAASVLGAIIDIATVHRLDCRQAACPTCLAIRDGLAANLANLRTLRSDAIEQRRVLA